MPTVIFDKIASGVNSGAKPSDLQPGVWMRSVNWRHFRNVLEKSRGWVKLTTTPLEDVPIMIDQLFLFGGQDFLLLGTKKDLYRLDPATKAGVPLTPRYTTGTVSIAGGTPTVVTGTGTTWTTNAKTGDWFRVDANGTWIAILTVNSNTQLTLVSAYPGAPHTGVAYTIRQTFVTTVDEPWDTEFMLDRMFFTTLADGLYRWNGSDTTVTKVTGTGLAKAKAILQFESRVLLFHLNDGNPKPQRLQWSDLVLAIDSIVWDPVAVGSTAGSIDLLEGSDWILEATKLGDFIVVFKERSIYLVSFVGGDFIFTRRLVIDGIGLLAARAYANIGDEIIFVGPDNFYSFNGISLEIAGEEIRDQFFNELDPSFNKRVHAVFHEETGEVVFSYPKSVSVDGTPDREVVYNTFEKHWYFRDKRDATVYGFYRETTTQTIDSDSRIIDNVAQLIDSRGFLANAPLNIFGVKSGHIMRLTEDVDGDGSAITCDLESGDLYLASVDRPDLKDAWKYLSAVIIDADDKSQPNKSIEVRVGTKRFEGDSVSFGAPKLLPLDGSKRGRLFLRDQKKSGKIVRLRLSNSELGAQIKVNAIGFEFEYGGVGRR